MTRGSVASLALALALALALVPGCLAPYGGADDASGIHGIAMMGPTCPVERDPPDPNCADRPYEGGLVATSADGGVSGRFTTDALGAFNVSLPAGEYTIRADTDAGLPTCGTADPVIVHAGRWTRVEIACDTGIR